MEENNTKEINLLQLINLFINWLKKISREVLNFIGYLFQLSFRHKVIVILTILVSLFYSLYLSRPSVRIYKVEAMAMIYGSEAQTVKEVCKQLENSLSNNNLYSLSAKLLIPDSVSRSIIGFQSFYVIGYLKDKDKDKVIERVDFDNNHSSTDTFNVKLKDRLYFRVLSKNISQIPKVQTAILNYFNNNQVMKDEFLSKKNDLLREIKICDIESQRIDSLAKVSYFRVADKQMQFDNNKLLIGEQKKQLFYGELLNIEDVRSKAESKYINFKQPIDFPSGMVVNPIPINGSLRYGIIGIFIGYLVALLLSILIENFKNIIKFLDKK